MNRKNRDYRIRKYKSVIVSAFLVLAMLFSLTACTAVGNTNESTDENSDKTVNSGADGEDNTEANTEESQLVSMGRYVETGIALPGNTDSYGRSMEVLSDGSFAYFEPSSGYYLSADEGENWQQKYSLEELTSGLGDYYINCSAISTEGSIAFVSVMF